MAPASSRLTHKGVVPTAPASDPGNSSTGKEEPRVADELSPRGRQSGVRAWGEKTSTGITGDPSPEGGDSLDLEPWP